MSTVVSCIVPSITSAQKVRSNFSGKNGKEAAAAQKCTEEKCTEEVGRALPALRFKEPRCHLGSVGIQDSHPGLVVIQAVDGPIRID